MTQNTAKYIIVGAGLSGLTSAYILDKLGETDYLLLESRERIGGRIYTSEGVDLGATWFQTHHQNVINLLDDLQIEKYNQYNKGKSVLVYNSMAPAHYFESDPNAPSAFRIKGGSSAVINTLAHVCKDRIKLSTRVSGISKNNSNITIQTDKGVFTAQKVIITIPPRIATQIKFTPQLPDTVTDVMNNTHTWMSNAMKVGLTFSKPFWRDKNLSGTIVGQVGAVTELYDHSCAKNTTFALMGFINEGLRDLTTVERKTRILDYLKKYLGDEILEYLSYQEKDWSQDNNTASNQIKSIYLSPKYGDSVFQDYYLEGSLLFSGAETSPFYGGYMDGAIYTGIQAAKKIVKD